MTFQSVPLSEFSCAFGLQASKNLGKRAGVIAHVGRRMIAENHIEAVVGKLRIRYVHADEAIRRLEAGVKVQGTEVDERITSVSNDALSAQVLHGNARAAHLRAGAQPRAYNFAKIPMYRSIARLGTTMRTTAEARWYAIEKKLGDPDFRTPNRSRGAVYVRSRQAASTARTGGDCEESGDRLVCRQVLSPVPECSCWLA